MNEYIFEMRNITKEFPGVRALDNVSFKVKQGEIHGLIGENGAGKSTLMKVLSGLYPSGSFEGEIVLKGKGQRFHTIKDSERAGIAVIYQELALVPQMNIMENIYLGNELHDRGVIDWHKSKANTIKVLGEVGLTIDPETKIINLGIGQQQLVEIAKAISKNAEILILDEPTAALNEHDSQNLLGIIRMLRDKGVTCIYISHKLEEVLELVDNCTVLRDGKTVVTDRVKGNKAMDEGKIISLMVGRTLSNRFPRRAHVPGRAVMEVRGWTVHDPDLPERKKVADVSFQVRQGEILGVAGLMGAGRTELAMSLFGAYGVNVSGGIFLEGSAVHIRNPADAIAQGVSYLSEDRKGNGLVLGMNILENISLASLGKISVANVVNSYQEIAAGEKYVKQLNIKTPSLEQLVKNLSGGNQQKVSLGKWLMTNPRVLILDEPTRGIDVGAKFEIYNIMNELVDQGVCVVMISSELPEILGMSDRILVMYEGRLNGELHRDEATQEKVMFYATGGE